MQRRPTEGRFHGLLAGLSLTPRVRSHAHGRTDPTAASKRQTRKTRRLMAKASRRANRRG